MNSSLRTRSLTTKLSASASCSAPSERRPPGLARSRRRHADVTAMRTKHTFRLPPDLAGKLADYAARKRVPQALVVEAALASHLSPDGADRLEAALARRLDRMNRHMERIERHVDISNEALAVFVRFWLTSTPALPDTALAAAQTKGRERYEGFVEALGRRLARGRKLADEVSRDVAPGSAGTDADAAGPIRTIPATCLSIPEPSCRIAVVAKTHFRLFLINPADTCASE